MKVLSHKLIVTISISLLISTTPGAAVAQSSFSGSSHRDQIQSTPETSRASVADNDAVSTQVVDGPFAQWGIPTPPGAEDYKVNQVTEEELNPQGLVEWHPTANPNAEIIPGKMRSDREEIPAGVDKAEADKTETREAQLVDPDTPTLNAHPGCGVYWPTSFEVCGLIKEKYDSIGGPTSFLLFPKTNELTNPDGIGKRSEFVNGYIYWHPKTGAHTVSLPTSKVWQRHGWEKVSLDILQPVTLLKETLGISKIFKADTSTPTMHYLRLKLVFKALSMTSGNPWAPKTVNSGIPSVMS